MRNTVTFGLFLGLMTCLAVVPAQAAEVRWDINGHCYELRQRALGIDWQTAQDESVADGGYLATITSAAENSFVFSLLIPNTGSVWLGGFQPVEPNGEWLWVTGEPFTYTNWEIGEPNNGGGGGFQEDGLTFFAQTSQTPRETWNDVSRTMPLNVYVFETEDCPAPPSGFCGPALPDPVSWWPADGDAQDVIDGNHGTLSTGATFAPGMVGQAFSLDGVDGRVDLLDDTNNLTPPEITIVAWVNPAGIKNGSRIISKDISPTSCPHPFVIYSLEVRGILGGRAVFFFTTSDDVLHEVASVSVIPLGVFTHIAGTYDGSVASIYVNGILEKQQAESGTLKSGGAPAVIGNGGLGCRAVVPGQIEFEGLIDEVQVFSSALTPGQISTIHLGAALQSWWPGNGTADDAVGTNHGILRNGITFQPGFTGQAFSFDGVDDLVEIVDADSLTPAASFTLEVWIRPLTLVGSQTIITKWGDQGDLSNQRSYGIGLVNSSIAFAISDDGMTDPSPFATSPDVVTVGEWSHIVAVYRQATGTREVYVNGALVAQRTHTPIVIFDGSGPLSLGAAIRSTTVINQHFDGLIDEIKYYDRDLTPEEIAALAGVPPCSTARIVPSNTTPSVGSTIAACAFVDLTNSTATLGSYGMTLSWDEAVLQFQSATGGDPPFDSPIVNSDDAVSGGNLAFADADATGTMGDTHVACFEFLVTGAAGTSTPLDLELTSLFDAVTLADLLPSATAQDSTINVVSSCTVGDLDNIGGINSGDALIVLKHEIALSLPDAIQDAIAAGCGDANGDGNTDSIDANIILSYEVGLPIDPTFPIGGGNGTIDTCPVCANGGGAPASMASDVGTIRADGEAVLARLLTPTDKAYRGEVFEVTLALDMSGSRERLGSYGAELRWNTRAVEFVDMLRGGTQGFTSPLTNLSESKSGIVRFADSNPHGAFGVVELVRVRFRALRALPHPRTTFTLEFTSMGATGPRFENLLPRLIVEDVARGNARRKH